MVCTKDYRPVCGDNGKTYGNGCSACAGREIDAYIEGECKLEEKKTICTEEQKQAQICTMDYTPVCGDNGKTYGNVCGACASKEIDAYTDGECELSSGEITNFEECIAAGNPAMESYPRQCRADGQTFVENVQ